MTYKPLALVASFTGLLLTSLLFTTWATPYSYSMEVVDQIVAVVNDDIVTAKQLENRMDFALKNVPSRISTTQKKELARTQIQELIEEELILEYAQEKGYTATQKQIDKTIARIEKQNKKSPGSFMRFAGDAKSSALRSIKNNVLTQKIQQRELRKKVQISQRNVNRIVEGIVSRKDNNAELKLAQIFLPVDGNDKKVRQTTERLHTQLQESSTNFKDLARAYSRDNSAKNGGVLGWFRLGELAPAISRAVNGLEKGQMSAPTRTSNGWHIFKVLDERMPDMPDLEPTTEVRLIQLYAPIDSTSDKPAQRQHEEHKKIFRGLTQDINSAKEFEKMVETQKEESPLFMASGDMGWVTTTGLAPELQTPLNNARAGEMVGPLSTKEGTYLFHVRDKRKQEAPALQKLRERVRERLTKRQLDLEMRRFIRDLRRQAFIDVRL